MPVPVWGTAKPGENVTVSFDGQSVSAKADAAGQWMVKLAPMKASKTGRDMVIRGENTLTLKDVLVGEVWLCSGQSNMADSFNRNKGKVIDPGVLQEAAAGIRFFTPGYKKPGTGVWNVLSEQTST